MDTLTPEQEDQLKILKKQGAFYLAVQNAYNQIIITNVEGDILYANQATQRITGYPQSDVIGSNPSLWGGQMSKEYYEDMWKTIKKDQRPFVSECTNKRNTGEKYEARLTISPILDENGELLGFVGTEEEIG